MRRISKDVQKRIIEGEELGAEEKSRMMAAEAAARRIGELKEAVEKVPERIEKLRHMKENIREELRTTEQKIVMWREYPSDSSIVERAEGKMEGLRIAERSVDKKIEDICRYEKRMRDELARLKGRS